MFEVLDYFVSLERYVSVTKSDFVPNAMRTLEEIKNVKIKISFISCKFKRSVIA